MTRASIAAFALLVTGAWPAVAQTVSGTVTYRERLMLPPTAVVEVTLADVSRADAPAVAIASTRVEPAGAPPIAFQLEYDPAAIHPGRRYAVRARILDRDRLMFTSTESYPVLTQGHGAEATVTVRQVGQPAPPPRNPEAAPRPAAPMAGAAPVAAPVDRPAPPPTLVELPASFIGTLPCDGCDGTRAHINLFPDDSFFLKLADQGRPNVRDDMGSWALSSDGTEVVLQGRGEPLRFALLDARSLRPIGSDGGPLGARHALSRAGRFQPLEVRLEMQGVFRRAGEVGLFTECSTGRTWEVSPDGDGSALAAQHDARGGAATEALLLTIEGRIAERPRGTGADPALRVDRVGTAATEAACVPRFTAAPLQRTNWNLIELGGTAVPPAADARSRPYLLFDDDTDRFSGAGGCNRLVGAYDVSGSGIALEVAGTMTACPQGDREAAFTSALTRARRFRIVGRVLTLFDESGAALARFESR